MCGIIGVFNLDGGPPVEVPLLEHMLALIRHRGPDETGIYHDDYIGLGSVRLSIVDLATGQQPLSNEDGTIWIVFNGEIFNYIELMAELKSRGHVFRTTCDTEVIVHLYEEFGVECLEKLNGQFVFAIWDTSKHELFLARDRVGIRPLFYTRAGVDLVFGSEIKPILLHPDVVSSLDPIALDQIFTFWTTLTPRTTFRDIYELPPGHYMVANARGIDIQRYWRLDFSSERSSSIEDAMGEFEALFRDAVRLRLRADVPVAAYLSGGLDSSTTSEFILRNTDSDLRTFSIGFTDPQFDETPYQEQMAQFLGTQHTSIKCSYTDISAAFLDVIWHTEIPILRTAPVPMYLLSKLVRQNTIKVVVTGEGSDEVLGGYDIFKEALVRRFYGRRPDSQIRPLLFSRLYPWMSQFQQSRNFVLQNFFGQGATDLSNPLYSHLPRWHTTARIKQFFAKDFQQEIGNYDSEATVLGQLAPDFESWSPLAQAQFLETTVFMSGYLLSSQGDRVTMANSVEGRYPFLDHRVIEFCATLPSQFKVFGLKEKYLLKRMMKKRLPKEIVQRPKQPYRAPIADTFLGTNAPAYVSQALSEEKIKQAGVFSPTAVSRLIKKAISGRSLSETDNMALVGILSTQLVHQMFVQQFEERANVPVQPVSRIISSNHHLM
jgi:asparagine synthase (glutamine-hydrolysing)